MSNLRPRNAPANPRDPWGFGLPTDRELTPEEWQALPNAALTAYAFGAGRQDEAREAREADDQQLVKELARDAEVFTPEQLMQMPLHEHLAHAFSTKTIDHRPEARLRFDPEADPEVDTEPEEDA